MAEANDRIGDGLSELLALIKHLRDDLGFAEQDLQQEDTQHRRRAFTRTLIAYVEAQTHALKGLAILMHEGNPLTFTRAELAMLYEEQYFLKENGGAVQKQRLMRLPENVRFSFEVHAKAFQSDFALDTSSAGWESLRSAIKIRNRITHPKSSADVEISDNDINCLRKAKDWYSYSAIEALLAANKPR